SVQMGGSDQWGNITSGTEFIRRNLNEKAYAVTTPLLTKSDGKKFGKSEQGNIWLDAKMTSPYKFYQFWINADDRDLPKFFRYFSLKNREEIEALEAEHEGNPQQLKRMLAEELTVRIHSKEAYESVLKVTDLLFNKKATAEALASMTVEEFQTVGEEISCFEIERSALEDGLNIIDLLAEKTTILSSKGEARKAMKNNAVAVNKVKEQNIERSITKTDLLQDAYLMIENGKKNKFLIKVN
ncbi:MAG: tyrosine--tRNA ligase, partial [bacterium]|nr:tyrosine--tRNA ligase [bacterium]